ncbi:MAG: hypothetical protein IT270_14895, partial [Saprospiraceae bacterium]|nr:hypothetical protein [Saprospiraceae bacterium]
LPAAAQTPLMPMPSPGVHILDRLDISSGVPAPFHAEVKSYTRQDAVNYALAIDSIKNGQLSKLDRADLDYLYRDNNEWIPDSMAQEQKRAKPWFKTFYKTPANFFEVNEKSFRLRANPVFHFFGGNEADDPEMVFANRRGLDVRGDVDGRLYFQTSFLETQARFPTYVNQWITEYQAVPGAGFYKTYKSEVINIENGYDFNVANAYIGFKASEHIGFQFGHGKQFIGNGYRSLFLSDVGNYTFFLKLSVRVWKLHYQCLFQELNTISTAVPRPSNSILPKKFTAMHYLSFKPNSKLAFGLFEGTIFNRSQDFEFQYLNPVILYRTVEGMIGSPDNVVLGLDARWNFLNRFQLYGQVIIDEFLFSEIYNPEQEGWWANKYGAQVGLKYINALGIDHLDLQMEYNTVRPFTYSHSDSLNSYTHYNQPLAHPLWSNFSEFIALARYQPLPRLTASARFLHMRYGENRPDENWGANALISNSSREQEYGNTIGQGVAGTTDLVGLDISWMLYHNLYVDLNVLYRLKNSDDNARDLTTKVIGVGLRMNIWNQNIDL